MRRRCRAGMLAAGVAGSVLALAGCGPGAGTTSAGGKTGASAAPVTSVSVTSGPVSSASQPGPGPVTASRRPPGPKLAAGLVVLHDPGSVTGTVSGPCHTRDGGRLPDARCTPGGIDPAVTQANIGSTICVSGYTARVRPPESQTEDFKFGRAYPAYGIASAVTGELDHLVPLEIGGDNDAANLWPEAGTLPNPKDSVENALHRAVCAGRVSLASAQRAIALNWETAEARLGLGGKAPAPAPVPASTPASRAAPVLHCTATVSNSSPADNATVYITVHTAAGAAVQAVAHYKTTSHPKQATAGASGVATIAYDVGGATPGYRVEVDITASAASRTASCSTSYTPVR